MAAFGTKREGTDTCHPPPVPLSCCCSGKPRRVPPVGLGHVSSDSSSARSARLWMKVLRSSSTQRRLRFMRTARMALTNRTSAGAPPPSPSPLVFSRRRRRGDKVGWAISTGWEGDSGEMTVRTDAAWKPYAHPCLTSSPAPTSATKLVWKSISTMRMAPTSADAHPRWQHEDIH